MGHEQMTIATWHFCLDLYGGMKLKCEFEIWIWNLNLKFEFEIWIWNRIWIWNLNLKSEFQIWIWNLNLKFEFEIWIWNLNLKFEFEIWIWNLNLKSEFEIWIWNARCVAPSASCGRDLKWSLCSSERFSWKPKVSLCSSERLVRKQSVRSYDVGVKQLLRFRAGWQLWPLHALCVSGLLFDS